MEVSILDDSALTIPDLPLVAMECYLCPVGADGQHPVREVVSERIVEAKRDATTVYKLSCGHTII